MGYPKAFIIILVSLILFRLLNYLNMQPTVLIFYIADFPWDRFGLWIFLRHFRPFRHTCIQNLFTRTLPVVFIVYIYFLDT